MIRENSTLISQLTVQWNNVSNAENALKEHLSDDGEMSDGGRDAILLQLIELGAHATAVDLVVSHDPLFESIFGVTGLIILLARENKAADARKLMPYIDMDDPCVAARAWSILAEETRAPEDIKKLRDVLNRNAQHSEDPEMMQAHIRLWHATNSPQDLEDARRYMRSMCKCDANRVIGFMRLACKTWEAQDFLAAASDLDQVSSQNPFRIRDVLASIFVTDGVYGTGVNEDRLQTAFAAIVSVDLKLAGTIARDL